MLSTVNVYQSLLYRNSCCDIKGLNEFVFSRTGTISPGDYLLAIGDVWLDNHSLEEAAHVLTSADKVVKLRIQKNECYAGMSSIQVVVL